MRHGSIHPEYLDLNPPRSPGQRQQLADLLLDKYAGTTFALIITVFDPARDFLQHEGREVSPGTPVVALFSRETGALAMAGRQVYPLPLRYDLSGTLASGLRLFPGTRRVLFVTGTAETKRRIEAQARRDFAPWEGRIAFDYTSRRVPHHRHPHLRAPGPAGAEPAQGPGRAGPGRA